MSAIEGGMSMRPANRHGRPTRDIHLVKPGETIGSIAAQYGIDAGQLAQANHIRVGMPVEPGTRLQMNPGGPMAEPLPFNPVVLQR